MANRGSRKRPPYRNSVALGFGNGGQESDCGWCKDRWGLSWQITPRALTDALASGDPEVSQRAFAVMMTMRKIDVAEIERAVAGS